uniref:Uncharacterized protein n=1 Tax=Amphiprion ocellaris TaxID=80972 RepID=A0A3Q1B160_AMPOC
INCGLGKLLFYVNPTCRPHLQQLLLHRVSDQVWSQSSGPAGQIIGGDGKRSLGSVQRLLQPRLQRQQGLGVGQQLLDVPLQLGPPVVDLLQPLPQQTRPLGLGPRSGRLGVLVQSSGLSLDAPGLVVVGTGLFKYSSVVGEPFVRGVFSRAVPGGAGEDSVSFLSHPDHHESFSKTNELLIKEAFKRLPQFKTKKPPG